MPVPGCRRQRLFQALCFIGGRRVCRSGMVETAAFHPVETAEPDCGVIRFFIALPGENVPVHHKKARNRVFYRTFRLRPERERQRVCLLFGNRQLLQKKRGRRARRFFSGRAGFDSVELWRSEGGWPAGGGKRSNRGDGLIGKGRALTLSSFSNGCFCTSTYKTEPVDTGFNETYRIRDRV